MLRRCEPLTNEALTCRASTPGTPCGTTGRRIPVMRDGDLLGRLLEASVGDVGARWVGAAAIPLARPPRGPHRTTMRIRTAGPSREPIRARRMIV